jgi:hypothetical protein
MDRRLMRKDPGLTVSQARRAWPFTSRFNTYELAVGPAQTLDIHKTVLQQRCHSEVDLARFCQGRFGRSGEVAALSSVGRVIGKILPM